MGKPLAIFAKDQDSVPSTTKGLVTITSVFPGTLTPSSGLCGQTYINTDSMFSLSLNSRMVFISL